jgi:hypothetical protein
MGLSGGQAWLASPAAGLVTLVDGASREIVGTVPVPGARSGDQLSVTESGASAYVADATRGTVSHVDGATYEVSAPVGFGTPAVPDDLRVYVAAAVGYVVSGGRRTAWVVDPGTLRVRAELALTSRPEPGQAVVDDSGRLWLVDAGALAWIEPSGIQHRSGLDVPGARLVLLDGRVVLVDPARHRTGRPAADGTVASWTCLNVASGDDARLLGSATLDRVLAAIPATGVLATSGSGAGDCGPAVGGVGAPGDRLGAPAEVAGFAFVPDWTTGTTSVVDLAARRVVAGLTLGRPGQRLDLLAKDGLVFYNDVDGDRVGVLTFDGRSWRPGPSLRKYGTDGAGPGELTPAGRAVAAPARGLVPPEPLVPADPTPPTGTGAAPPPSPSGGPGPAPAGPPPPGIVPGGPPPGGAGPAPAGSGPGPAAPPGARRPAPVGTGSPPGTGTGTGPAPGGSPTTTAPVTSTPAPPPQTLTVRGTAGAGTVTGTGIDCGTTCVHSYPAGTVVTLTAVPAAGNIFQGWTGACGGTGGCTVTMTAARTVVATFATDSGHVPPPNDPGPGCGDRCR